VKGSILIGRAGMEASQADMGTTFKGGKEEKGVRSRFDGGVLLGGSA